MTDITHVLWSMVIHLFFISEHIRKKWIINPPSQLTNKYKNIDFIKQQRATSSTTDNEDSSNSILSLKNIDTSKWTDERLVTMFLVKASLIKVSYEVIHILHFVINISKMLHWYHESIEINATVACHQETETSI